MMIKLWWFAAAVVLATPLHAHDFWLIPSSFHPADGERVTVTLMVGEKLAGEPVQRRPSPMIERFAAILRDGEAPVAGVAGAHPAGGFTVSGRGLIRVIYQGKPGSVALPARKFEQYLREEGLEGIIAVRRARGESANDSREWFSRSSKTLLDAGGSSSEGDAASGLPLEIIAESNPYGGAREIVFRVDFRGRPLEGTLVSALNGAGRPPVRARTDASGRVRFDVSRPGLWLIETVHMVEAPSGSGADWHSIWASLTFDRTR